jgi:tol-pal system protein YbgF
LTATLKFGAFALALMMIGGASAQEQSHRSWQVAQLAVTPPGSIPDGGDDSGDRASQQVLRIDRLENEVRALNGALEQMQYQQQKLADQLKRFQEDVEFRLNGAKPAPAVTADAAPPMPKPKRSDAFDPQAYPNAPGAPRQIGTTPASPPLAVRPGDPLDISHATPPPSDAPTVIAGIPGPAPATGPSDGPREQYNSALEAYRAGQYEAAETQLRDFLSRYNGSLLTPDAVFYLGETYFRRSRPREAAEQYLRLSTDFAKSKRAPEGMLRLGQSLAALGNNDQACATFGEVTRRYPIMASNVKKGVEAEMQKDHC